jgi:hypothetical protein
VAYWTWPLNLLGLALLLLLFPDGRLPSRRWRIVPWLLGLSFAGITVWTMLHPTLLDLGMVKTANPAGVAALDDRAVQGLGTIVGTLAILIVFVGSVACALAPIVRRRRAQPIERQQLKWLAAVATATGLAGATGFVMGGFDNTSVAVAGRLLLLLALAGVVVGIPAAVGVAVLRYRLYDLDQLISRTLVYGLLTGAWPRLYRHRPGLEPAVRRHRWRTAELGSGRRHPLSRGPVPTGPPPHPDGRGSALQPPQVQRRQDRGSLQPSTPGRGRPGRAVYRTA